MAEGTRPLKTDCHAMDMVAAAQISKKVVAPRGRGRPKGGVKGRGKGKEQ